MTENLSVESCKHLCMSRWSICLGDVTLEFLLQRLKRLNLSSLDSRSVSGLWRSVVFGLQGESLCVPLREVMNCVCYLVCDWLLFLFFIALFIFLFFFSPGCKPNVPREDNKDFFNWLIAGQNIYFMQNVVWKKEEKVWKVCAVWIKWKNKKWQRAACVSYSCAA